MRVGGKPSLVPKDPNGNQTSKTTNGVTTTNIYDIRDKLAEVTQGPSTLARFQYDAEGRLLKKIGAPTYGGDSGVRQYVYDQTSRLLECDGSGSAIARFSYGSDRLISMWHLTEGTRFYHLDGLRSVTALTDTAGAVTANLRLDAWGNFRFPTDLNSSANRFAFTGHVFDTETGLYYAKARYFDPKLGRFLTQDSFLGEIDEPPSLHRYVYGWNRPTFYIDRTGHVVSVATESEEEKPQQRLLGGSEAKIGPSEGGSAGRGAFYYTLETGAELISPIPLGLSSPETSVHPLAGDNQATEDYEAFKARYGRGAQAVEGAAAMKYGGKLGKLVGVTMIIGAAIYGANEINGTQAEEGNLGPDKGDREPLPAEKEKLSRPPVRAGERTTFEDFRARSIPGDALEGHELVQHAKMRDQGLAGKRRLSTAASKQNPVIALERATHGEVTAAQVEQGTKDLPIVRSLRANVKILLEKTEIPRHEIAQLLKDAYAHAKKWKVE